MTINRDAIHRPSSKDKDARPVDIRLTSKLLFPILFLLTTLALAADASGKWNGSLEFKGEDGQTQTASAHAEMKQEAHAVTGRIWKEEGQQFEIEQGQVTGNEISFKFRAPEGEDEQMLVHSVRLTLVGPTQLQGTLEFELGGQKVSGKLTFSREK
jgi:hypothetical protein